MTPPIADTASAPPRELAVLDDPLELARFTRFSVGADGQRVAESSFRISGMHCAACSGIIEQALVGVDGVLKASVSSAGERAQVHWIPDRTGPSALIAAIQAAGYGAVPDSAMQARQARKLEQRAALWRLFVASFCAMQVMMLATPSYVAHGDDLAPDMRQLLNWGSWLLSLPVLAFASGPFFQGAWNSLKAKRIGMDVPVSLGLAVTFVASTGATFDPGGVFGSEVYFDSMTMFVSFLLAGRWLEVRARHRVAQVLESALDGMPETATRCGPDGQPEVVSVMRLVPGDRVQVALGQAFPADGQIVEGSTQADEALLTGESRPVPKVMGSDVVGGSVNLGAPITMRVDRVGADTRLQGIIELMQGAMTQRPSAALAADRWAGPFLWAVLLLSAGAAAAWSLIDPSKAIWVAVSVLIVTCPCALSLAVPAALLSAASALARRGVLLHRLDALERWARVQRVYFDKTGTLTDEALTFRRWSSDDPHVGEADARGHLNVAAALGSRSVHPISRAVANLGDAASHPELTEVVEHPGLGVEGRTSEGRRWRLGQEAFVRGDSHDACGPSDDAPAHSAGQSEKPVGWSAGHEPAVAAWIGADGGPAIRLEFDESLRRDAGPAIEALRQRGMEVVLLSGDLEARAAGLADRIEFDRVIGGATPESKLAEIEQAQAAGLQVAMVGDGINDAPVLARADVSFAMGQGALVAKAHADAVVASNRLIDLVHMRDVAIRTMRIVRQNLAWAAVYNLTCIPLALVGWLPPWAAGLGMASSSAFVILNAMRLAK